VASHSARRPIGGLHLRELARISELVTASGDADTLLDAVAALALDLVDGVEVVAFWAADEAARTLTLRSLMPAGRRGNFPVTSVAYGTGLAGWVAEHRISALVDDLACDPRVLLPDTWASLGLASAFALPIVRKPAAKIATALGGGYLASGSGDPARLPGPWLPAGLSLDDEEGAGEVQTPLLGEAAESLSIGDRVYLRHAKAGELCERFNTLHLVQGEEIVDEVPTYRGEGQAFL